MSRVPEWKSTLAHGGTVELGRSRPRLLVTVLGMIVFALGGALIISLDDGLKSMIIGWLVLLTFGGLVPVFVHHFFVKTPEVRVSPEGIRFRRSGQALIPWSSIEGAGPSWVGAYGRMVTLRVDDAAYHGQFPDSGLRSLPSLGYRAGWGPNEVALPNGLGASPAQLGGWLDEEVMARNPQLNGGTPLSAEQMREVDAEILRDRDDIP